MATVNNITQILQDDIKELMASFSYLYGECADIFEVYWNTDANTTIGAVTNGTDPVSETTKLTKTEFANGITTVENFIKFCTNQAVATTDHLSYCHNMAYGTATPTKLDDLIENIADRMKLVCQQLIANYTAYLEISKIYTENEIVDIVAVLDNERVIYGASMSRSDLSSAMSMLQEFGDYMANAAVTQGNYLSTIAKWNLY